MNNTITIKTKTNQIIVLHDIMVDNFGIYGIDTNNHKYTISYNAIKTAQYTIL